jgi:hypothetical protein
MKTEVDTQNDLVQSFINLQLAGAAVGQGGSLSIKQLYANIKRYGGQGLTFSEFVEHLEDARFDYGIRDGEIGVDVNYISLKKD